MQEQRKQVQNDCPFKLYLEIERAKTVFNEKLKKAQENWFPSSKNGEFFQKFFFYKKHHKVIIRLFTLFERI